MLEYSITPSFLPPVAPATWNEPPYQWATTPIGYLPPNPLTGFTVGVRPYAITTIPPDPNTTPPTPETTTRVYPPWTLVSQTFVPLAPHNNPNPFTTETGNELFTATAGAYVGFYAYAGITDGSAYAFAKTFDQSVFRYLERGYEPPTAPPPVDGSVDGEIPREPYDPTNNIYPTAAVVTFMPDTRQYVLVQYELTTTYDMGLGSISETAVVSQYIIQSINDWGDACRAEIERTEYFHSLGGSFDSGYPLPPTNPNYPYPPPAPPGI